MPSEREQRRIDGLLDQAEEAVAAMDWSRARDAAEAVLVADPQNEDAKTFLAMAERVGGTTCQGWSKTVPVRRSKSGPPRRRSQRCGFGLMERARYGREPASSGLEDEGSRRSLVCLRR